MWASSLVQWQPSYRRSRSVSHRLPITDWQTAFELVTNRQSLKVLMYPV